MMDRVDGVLGFCKARPLVMHIDLNSCFASVEQQARPNLRGKPIAVAAYVSDNGCILAPSIEAKRFGVKTGMRVREGKALCPELIVLPTDSDKYRFVHKEFHKILSAYTDELWPKSIDEFVMNMEGTPASRNSLIETAREIKMRIRSEIGDWLKVSVGIGTNRFLAKTASGLNKPDGLDVIDDSNYWSIYEGLTLTDLNGIDKKNKARLNRVGVFTVWDFYNADLQTLKAAFCSVASYYWYMRLRGFEIDDFEMSRRSFGNSYSIPVKLQSNEEIAPVLTKLCTKASYRMRKAGYKAMGVHLAVYFKDGGWWHKGMKLKYEIFDFRDVYREVYRLWKMNPQRKPVRTLFVTCMELSADNGVTQLALFDKVLAKKRLMKSIDELTGKYGEYTITPARMINTKQYVPDRIGFGNVREMEK
jgi:DNA polymerase IV